MKMSPRRSNKAAALAALALLACLWALPAVAEAPDAAPETAAAQREGSPAGLGGLTTTTGGAVLIGAGAYSYVRKQRWEERDRRRAEQKEPVYFENHTRTGTLRPGEQDDFE